MIRCAITDGQVIESGAEQLTDLAAEWARAGIDLIQLREKTLEAAELADLARKILQAIAGSRTRLLVNHRADVAAAAGAHGVHLTAAPGEVMANQVRAVFEQAGLPQPVVGISCHNLDEVRRAVAAGVNLILFGPIFGKSARGEAVAEGIGLEMLSAACAAAGAVPVLALGGVTAENAQTCIAAGAAGIAGIRLFYR